tara:strand:+ start:339 stop:617 length:279 start_codon:yes stop_codon:yes gene_type:complete
MFELQKPKLHRTVKGTDKHNRYNVFSLWWDSESFDKELGLKYPETFTITCTIDGETAASENWNNYDFQSYEDMDEALKEMDYWEEQLINSTS